MKKLFLGMIVLGIFLLLGAHWYGFYQAKAKAEKAAATQVAAEYARLHPPPPPPTAAPPTKIRATTPATITANYGFSLEANGPIMVQYPDEKPFLFDPGKSGDCQPLPQPRQSGPKKFWDPKDPTNGHISFRIYRGKGECTP